MLVLVLVAALFASVSAATPQRAPRLDGRIVGGEEVDIKDYPYQVSMQYYNTHSCGGSIITKRHIVTAAHCITTTAVSSLTVRAGSSKHASGGQVIKVIAIHNHPEYSSSSVDYDISILELAEDLIYGDDVQPVRLPNKHQEAADDAEAFCSGWGTIDEEETGGPDILRAVQVNIVNKAICKKQYEDYGFDTLITDNMICAGVRGGGKDACQGDSGSPLVIDGILNGVVSWGVGCARPEYSGVYASVANLRDHITQVTGI